MDATQRLSDWLTSHPQPIANVVDVATGDKLYQFNLTRPNAELTTEILNDLGLFSNWVNTKLAVNNCRYGIGGYMELRAIYDNRAQFEAGGGQRQLHLGVDIWADAGTPVYAPRGGTIHSFQDNDHFGDYGPTIIITHNLDGFIFYSLYGHLSRPNLTGLTVGQQISTGQKIGNFGGSHENGSWPPHLHFQLMLDMEGNIGDYPGACKNSDKELYLKNIPNPALLLPFYNLNSL